MVINIEFQQSENFLTIFTLKSSGLYCESIKYEQLVEVNSIKNVPKGTKSTNAVRAVFRPDKHLGWCAGRPVNQIYFHQAVKKIFSPKYCKFDILTWDSQTQFFSCKIVGWFWQRGRATSCTVCVFIFWFRTKIWCINRRDIGYTVVGSRLLYSSNDL